ncbi:MAG: HNH endonuclease signature motif containing protein [Pseudomonadota bacterium]
MAIRRQCAHPGCRALVAIGSTHCARHAPAAEAAKRARGRRHDAQRAEKPWRSWYKLAKWRRLRQVQLNREPLCRYCLENDILTSAEVVDHKRPHRGDPVLFWALDNLQSLCKSCHDGRKQAEERAAERTGRGPKIAVEAALGTGEGSHIFARDEFDGGVS